MLSQTCSAQVGREEQLPAFREEGLLGRKGFLRCAWWFYLGCARPKTCWAVAAQYLGSRYFLFSLTKLSTLKVEKGSNCSGKRYVFLWLRTLAGYNYAEIQMEKTRWGVWFCWSGGIVVVFALCACVDQLCNRSIYISSSSGAFWILGVKPKNKQIVFLSCSWARFGGDLGVSS